MEGPRELYVHIDALEPWSIRVTATDEVAFYGQIVGRIRGLDGGRSISLFRLGVLLCAFAAADSPIDDSIYDVDGRLVAQLTENGAILDGSAKRFAGYYDTLGLVQLEDVSNKAFPASVRLEESVQIVGPRDLAIEVDIAPSWTVHVNANDTLAINGQLHGRVVGFDTSGSSLIRLAAVLCAYSWIDPAWIPLPEPPPPHFRAMSLP